MSLELLKFELVLLSWFVCGRCVSVREVVYLTMKFLCVLVKSKVKLYLFLGYQCRKKLCQLCGIGLLMNETFNDGILACDSPPSCL